MSYTQSYNPCDDCPYSYSKNGQEMTECTICEFKAELNRIGKIIKRLQRELELASKEKERASIENPSQFDFARGYALGIARAIWAVKGGA